MRHSSLEWVVTLMGGQREASRSSLPPPAVWKKLPTCLKMHCAGFLLPKNRMCSSDKQSALCPLRAAKLENERASLKLVSLSDPHGVGDKNVEFEHSSG
ncbi:hypothetical protein TNIN_379241 [Trichonephila inaurata madagascariensis]|uniref:Uncharacterized protein n=1 Tax=Trichonephila inaurata madagascariensis TaxID=2747483 RepID=A0A8X6IYK1_9ARAC|nr:hypothetical protein TNIN_379241 [Trichonephila inaurata madagascariensis]